MDPLSFMEQAPGLQHMLLGTVSLCTITGSRQAQSNLLRYILYLVGHEVLVGHGFVGGEDEVGAEV